ncbi:MAG TPA: hypothetical protein VGE52_08630 [Pirellulales bacterium]
MGSRRIQFMHLGRHYTWNIGPVSEDEGERIKAGVELRLMRIKQGLLSVPNDVDMNDESSVSND